MDIGSAVGRASGLSKDQLAELAQYPDSPLFSELERDALRLADGMTATPAEVAPDVIERLKARLSEAQLVEIVDAIAWENFRARSNRAFDVQSEGFSGDFCALPASLIASASAIHGSG